MHEQLGIIGGPEVSRPTQPVLALIPAEAVPIGPVAGLVETDQGGVVFVAGMATFAFAASDKVGRRLAAAQLVDGQIASVSEVTAAFGCTQSTLWRWRQALASKGVAGLIPDKTGPKGPSKLTGTLADKIRLLDRQGQSLMVIAEATGVSTATVRVALGRVTTPSRDHTKTGTGPETPLEADPHAQLEARFDFDSKTPLNSQLGVDSETQVEAGPGPDPEAEAGSHTQPGAGGGLVVLADPVPRRAERALARTGLLTEAPVVFTEGARLPLVGLLLVLPALAHTGLLEVFKTVFGRLRNGFYGLDQVVLTMVFLALLRDGRAEGATRIRPADLGRLLGLDRVPEVKTLRRKLNEMAGQGKGAAVQAGLAAAHAAARPDALGFLHVDGHTRVYTGRRDLPKTYVARMHMAARATSETWIADAFADPVMVVTAPPAASLVSELVRLIPHIRAIVGPDRRATVIFDRGGWSADCFQKLINAQLDILTYRKAPYDQLPDAAFTEHSYTSPDGKEHTYQLADTTVSLPLRGGKTRLELRQICKKTPTGTQIPILTSQTSVSAAELCWRIGARWRQENYFRYAREHFNLDSLDSYTDQGDNPDRLVPNPVKKQATARVETARTDLAAAHRALADAITDAAHRAGTSGGAATVNPNPPKAITQAQRRLDQATTARSKVPSHVPLNQVRPDARLLDEELKLLTHAIRMAAYNAETTLARALAPHYARAEDEARALLREAFTLTGDIQLDDHHLHVQLDPATAPRRSRALQALCEELTATGTTYPGTNLTITYTVKGQPNRS